MARKHGKKESDRRPNDHVSIIWYDAKVDFRPPPVNIFITYTDMRRYGVAEPDVEWKLEALRVKLDYLSDSIWTMVIGVLLLLA